ncbi:hypothetical protein QIG64_27115, partial [Klebsiella pneumoniae]|nr:hypothetical protein [Klebsiella pneumoniae]
LHWSSLHSNQTPLRSATLTQTGVDAGFEYKNQRASGVLRRSRFVFPKMKFNTLSIAQIKRLQRQENQPESHANWLIL